MPAHVKPVSDWSTAFASPAPEPAALTPDGVIVLSPAERADWLSRFGGDRALDDALAVAANYVQPNRLKPMVVQVRAQLARQIADRSDRDRRYADAAKQRASAPTASSQAPAPMSSADRRVAAAREQSALFDAVFASERAAEEARKLDPMSTS